MEQSISFTSVNDSYNVLKKMNYVKLGENTMYVLATIAAIIVGIISYTSTAVQLWWLDNGENLIKSIKTNTNRVFNFMHPSSV